MKNKRLITVLASVIIVFVCLIAFPLCANAESPYTEGQEYKSTDGSMYYFDRDSGEAWFVTDNQWHQAIYNSDASFNNLAQAVRTSMYNREDTFTAYVAFDMSMLDRERYNSDKHAYLDELVTDSLIESVYTDDGTPYGGDYLRQTTKINELYYPATFNINDHNTELFFTKVTYNFSYITTYEQEQIVQRFVNYFDRYFIDANPEIAKSTGNVREYYTVKTIYNFLAKNVCYDNGVYQDVTHEKYPVGSARYNVAHSAYGAIYGTVEGVYSSDFDASKYITDQLVDTQGLYRIRHRDQGRAVCEGYTLLFYALCKSNGIDCRIVTGDYDLTATDKASDPHAWNMVFLKDSVEDDYQWYSVDTTFASKRTQKLNDHYTVVDYSFFLRGYETGEFAPEKHQKAYDDYSSYNLSTDDFRFETGDIDDVDTAQDITIIAIITRMKTDNPEEKFVEDGNYIYENYTIIDLNGNLYKIDPDKENTLKKTEGFYFNSKGYYYTCEFIDFAQGIEYVSQGKYLKDVGEYSFELKTVLGNNVYTEKFEILPLHMGNLKENYDLEATKINDSDLSSIELTDDTLTLKTEYTGADVTISVRIVDSEKTELVEGKDYTYVTLRYKDGKYYSTSLNEPGDNYFLAINYQGNYAGQVLIPIVVTKADLSRYERSVIVSFGADITSNKTFQLGSGTHYITLVNGTDFKIVDVTPYKNVGDTGTFKIVALAGSKYLQEGTFAVWSYTVDNPMDLSGVYTSYTVPDQYYTGKEIEPVIPNPKYSGETLVLVRGTDYDVEYHNNVEIGTATMTVTFKGNYTGTVTKTFKIVEKPVTPSQDTVKVGWAKRDGYWVYVSKVETSGNNINVTLLTGWLNDGGKWYYLDRNNNCRMATGWLKISGVWFYFDSSGVMQTGWQKISSKWYYFKSSGAMLTGWQKISNKWYYFNSGGQMLTGWQKISNKWYYFTSGGQMLTGWQKLSNKWYYFQSGGAMQTGWLKLSGKWYYFQSSGAMVTGSKKIGSKTYRFNSSGVCLNP